jgi:nucleoside-diphosphate-sugar epimerase
LREVGIPARAADLSDAAAVAALAEEWHGDTAVVHCATGGRGGTADAYRVVYLEGMRHLRAAFPRASRLIFTSSTSVYPQTDGSLVNENSPANPDRETGRILRQTEDETLAAGGTVVRLAGLYGPGRSVLLRDFLTGKSVIDVRSAAPATPDGRWTNQIHRDDAARALLFLLIEADEAAVRGRIFNAADSTPMRQRELYQELARRFSRPLPPEAPPDASRKRGWTHKRVDASRLRALGWQPQFPSWFDALDHDTELVPSIMAQIC